MHVLNVDRVVHENPYTGDRITTAFIINIDSISSSSVSEASEPAPPQNNNTAKPSKLPVVAIKYLSDCRKVRKKSACRRSRGSWSSSDESDNSEDDDGQENDDEDDRVAIREFMLGQIKVPEGIKFGVKARREIRALKAAQGHPNVVSFLGFTGPCIENPFAENGPSDLNSTLLLSPGAQERSVLGFGRPLFMDSLSASDPQEAGTSILHTGLSFQLNHAALSESEHGDDSDDDQDDYRNRDHNELVTKDANYWRRVFDRQPRPGGIILPFAPITLYDLIWIGWTRTRPLLVESCMRQILAGLEWIHEEARLIHRDISSGNILVSVAGSGSGVSIHDQGPFFGGTSGIVQCMISDFGCATPYEGQIRETEESSNNGAQENSQGLTFEVGTRAYRAPELLFSSGDYTTSVDIWSAGVLFAEMFLGRTLFEADSDIGQVCSIVKVLGTPTEENWPEYSTMPDYGKLLFKSLDTTPLVTILRPQPVEISAADTDGPPTVISDTAFELIERMVVYSGGRRISAREALAYKDRYLDDSSDKESQDCWLDIDIILDEKRRLKEKLEDEDEDDGGYGYMVGESRSPRYGHGNFSRSVEEDEEDEVERYRSDDLYGEEDNITDYDTAPLPLAVGSSSQGGASEGHEDYDEERSPKRRR
ncbi:Cyclin-dependent kinase 20 [Podila epicladia]|nr:Cyclin-dependent kinase 20 [Podila epicladia]KAG0099446.1 Cyclin-dependent kinase 20 [Podila epicladia]